MAEPLLFQDSLWEEYALLEVADVVVDVDAPDLQPTYSYRIPDPLLNRIAPGVCVHVPFHGREVLGYVLERRQIALDDPLCSKLKSVIGIVADAVSINEEQLHLVRWMSEHYVCDLLSAIRCVAPPILVNKVETFVRLTDPNLRGFDVAGSVPQAHLVETLHHLGGDSELGELKDAANLSSFPAAYAALLRKGVITEERLVQRAKVVGKKRKAYLLGAAADTLDAGRRSPQQQRLLHALVEWTAKTTEPMPADELLRRADASAASLRGLAEKNLVQSVDIIVHRAPVAAPKERTVAPVLTPGQAQAADALRDALNHDQAQTVLLFGVTASGKTEVYLDAIAHCLALGRSAIVLVPEIALTAQVVDVFLGRFGEQVAVLHSKLSEGERHDEWRRMQEGKARIVVGARSAIFAPVNNVGLIVLDEEHESSYKQEKMPRYHARDLAWERAQFSRATLLLGSATPSLETFSQSEGVGRVEMRQRIDNRPLPTVQVVDLRDEFKQHKALFSHALIDAMGARLAHKQQTILFLNRRGYAQFVLCRDCGWVAKCPNCAVSLAFHAYARSLKCHHCEYTGRAPQACPDCGGAKVKAFGIGTEKVEEEVSKYFPSARVARMDRDTTSQKGAHTRLIRDFRMGDYDILIGTQMVAKGLDFPNVTLVGVVSADTAINMPDFRAAERTFQLLTQVAGRAGRGVTPGEVIIQTFSPDHYAVQAATHQDYEAFYRQEIEFRRELKYPPFARFVNLICADINERTASERANRLATALEGTAPREIEIIGPSAAPLARLKNQFRFHVAMRIPLGIEPSGIVRNALLGLPLSDRLSISIDIDPLSMA
jgi:primosomal protein N' (replication factor Y) (superfamily II helicase)